MCISLVLKILISVLVFVFELEVAMAMASMIKGLFRNSEHFFYGPIITSYILKLYIFVHTNMAVVA